VSSASTQHGYVNTAVGYGGASDRRVHFGLGPDTVVRELTITWALGGTLTLRDVPADQVVHVREPDRPTSPP